MRITLIGHASVLVEMDGFTCLMDPVLFDPFEEGVVASCPRREVDLAALPPIDAVVVSHRHPDHFDIRSLASLPRECVALCPPDPLVEYTLRRLGFSNVRAVSPTRPLSLGDGQLVPTASQEGPLEFGLVFSDGSGVFWNQVDTLLSLRTIREARARFPGIDLLFARYACQNFDFFEERTTQFPYEEHQRNLETVLAVRPKVTVPGAAGFQFHGDHAWLNRFLFPIAPERFAADLRALDPSARVETIAPGDEVEVADGQVQVRRAASPFVRTVQTDPDALRFDPTSPVPPLFDPNDSRYTRGQLEKAIGALIHGGLFSYATQAVGEHLSVPFLYRSSGAVYGLEVISPWGAMAWRIDFRSPQVTLREGTDDANIIHRIAASVLADWVGRRRSYFSVRAYSRRFSTLYRLSGDATGVYARPVRLPDLLVHYLLNVAPGAADAAKQRIEAEVDRYARRGPRSARRR